MMQIPAEWKAALTAVQAIYPEAVIAGGCLRDLDNGREVKDIDIFVRGDAAPVLENLHARLLREGYAAEDIDEDSMYPVGERNEVVGFFEMEFEGLDVPLQIIMVNWDTARICDRFDFGICRIAFDGEKLIRTPEYEQDKTDRVFRLRRQRDDIEMVASVHRFARLSRKYEGWPFALFAEVDDEFELFSL